MTIYPQPKQPVSDIYVEEKLTYIPAMWLGLADGDAKYFAMLDYAEEIWPKNYADYFTVINRVVMRISGMEEKVNGLVFEAGLELQGMVTALRIQNHAVELMPSPNEIEVFSFVA